MIRVNPTKVALKSEDLKEYEAAKVHCSCSLTTLTLTSFRTYVCMYV